MGLLREIKHMLGMDRDGDDIRGWDVVDSGGVVFGKVEDLMYDPDTHSVRYAIVEHDGRRALIPVGDLTAYNQGDRRVVANGYDQERFLSMREYETTRWDDTEERETYRTFVPNDEAPALDYRSDRFRREGFHPIQRMEERLAAPRRELSFSGTEPTEADLIERDRLRQQPIITPLGDRIPVDGELGDTL